MRAKRISAIMGPASTLKQKDFSANVSLATVASFVKLTLMIACQIPVRTMENVLIWSMIINAIVKMNLKERIVTVVKVA